MNMMSIPQVPHDFIRTGRLGHIRPELDGIDFIYDPVTGAYTPREGNDIRTLAAEPTERFMRVMQALQASYPEDPSIRGFSIRDSHGWDEVVSQADMAQEKYKARAKGFSGILPKVGRKTREVSDAATSFVNLLPQSSYTSIVYGGLVLVLKACQSVQEIRQKVMDTLADSSRLFEEAESLVRIYPQDPKLNVKVHHLYVALLITIEGSIKWLDDRKWEPFKALMQQGVYAKGYDDKVALLNSCAKEVRQQADLCHQQNSVKISQAVEQQRAAINELNGQVNTGFGEVKLDLRDFRCEMRESVSSMNTEFIAKLGHLETNLDSNFGHLATGMDNSFNENSQNMHNGFEGMSTQMQDFRTEWRAQTSHLEQLFEKSLVSNALTAFVQQLSEEKGVLAWQKKEMEDKVRRTEAENTALKQGLDQTRIANTWTPMAPPPLLSQAEVLQILGSVERAGEADLMHYIRYTRAINPNPALADAIISHPKFVSWFAFAISQILFLEPNTPLGKMSPSSFVTATLAQTIGQMPTPIPLLHFCRGPAGANMNVGAAAYLMASLISQLLSKRQFDLSQWTAIAHLQDHHENLQSWNLEYLCSFLKHLVNLLPYGTVFCLIDDFYHLEHSTSEDSLGTLIQCFSELVQTCTTNDRAVFKVLVVMPDYKGSVVRYAPEGDLLRIGTGAAMKPHSHAMTSKQQRFHMEVARRKAGGGGSWIDSSYVDPYPGQYRRM